MTAHVDTFTADNLPPPEQWPKLRLEPPFVYPPQLNCAAELVDAHVAAGRGDRPAV